MARAFHTLAILAAVALAAGCSVNESPAPGLTGPSELSLALSMSATPDTIDQDGSSQSLVVILARDAAGRAVAGLPVRFDVTRNGQVVDFGTLSAKTATTSTDGRASAVYTAPAPPLNSPQPQSTPTTVSVIVTPIGTNYTSMQPRAVDIRLVPVGPVVPPDGNLVASFAFDGIPPEAVPPIPARKPGVPVVFDATKSSSAAGIASYAWDFGDGTTGNGVTVQHTFIVGGTYGVRLSVTDKKGLSAWTTRFITVGAGPTADFNWLPPSPSVGQEVTVNGLHSWAVPPATITTYTWAYPSSCATPLPNAPRLICTFNSPGSYSITLKVTDSQNLESEITKAITVK